MLRIKRLFKSVTNRKELGSSKDTAHMHKSTLANPYSYFNRQTSETFTNLLVIELVLDLKSALNSLTTVAELSSFFLPRILLNHFKYFGLALFGLFLSYSFGPHHDHRISNELDNVSSVVRYDLHQVFHVSVDNEGKLLWASCSSLSQFLWYTCKPAKLLNALLPDISEDNDSVKWLDLREGSGIYTF